MKNEMNDTGKLNEDELLAKETPEQIEQQLDGDQSATKETNEEDEKGGVSNKRQSPYSRKSKKDQEPKVEESNNEENSEVEDNYEEDQEDEEYEEQEAGGFDIGTMAKRVLSYIKEGAEEVNKETILKYAALAVVAFYGVRKSGIVRNLLISMVVSAVAKYLVEDIEKAQEKEAGTAK